MKKKMNYIKISMTLAILLQFLAVLSPTVLLKAQTSATTSVVTNSHSKDDIVFTLDMKSRTPEKRGWFGGDATFVYSSMKGFTETIDLYAPDTLDVHSYITAVGYLMEFIELNKKDPSFYNVRFQGSTYAIAKTDIEAVLYKDEIKSFPKYYRDGDIVTHLIEGNPLVENSWYFKSELGKAPDWMLAGQDYYSFNGIYFTDKIGNLSYRKMNKKTVNKKIPYYDYYLYLPLRTQTSYTAVELNRGFNHLYKDTSFVESESNMKASGNMFLTSQKEYGINALLLMSIAMNESAFGTSGYAIEDNNLFGYNAVDSYPDNADKFPSLAKGIGEVANLISWSYGDSSYEDGNNYYGFHLGNKASGMNVKYASDPLWGEKAASNMAKIDRYLGNKDFEKYHVAIAKQGSLVAWAPKKKQQAFTYKKSTSTLEYMYPVVLTKESKWSTIVMEPPYTANKDITTIDNNGGAFTQQDAYIRKNKLLIL